MFSLDTFTVANQMLGETQLAAALRVQSSQRRSQFDELLEIVLSKKLYSESDPQ